MTKRGLNVAFTQNVEGLDQLGPEFMKAVFGMDIGDVGIAVNHPQTIVYVVRVISVTPSEKTLEDRFTRATSDNLGGAAIYDLSDRQRALIDALRKEFNLNLGVREDQQEDK